VLAPLFFTMKILIEFLSVITFLTAIGLGVFIILILLKKIIYSPPGSTNKTDKKTSQYLPLLGACLPLCFISSLGSKEIIRYEFRKTLKESKIESVEVNGFFFGREDATKMFSKLEYDPGRYHCESYPGIITFENNESTPIEIIRHCYEKNQYIIVSRKYSENVSIGIITTSELDHIINNTDSGDLNTP